MLEKLLIKLIDIYQNYGGGKKIFGIECNYSPTCSEYMRISIVKYGLIKGLINGIRRINRCKDENIIEVVVEKP